MIKLQDIKNELRIKLTETSDFTSAIIDVVELQYTKRTGKTRIDNSEIEQILFAVEYCLYEIYNDLTFVKSKSFIVHDRILKEIISRNNLQLGSGQDFKLEATRSA